MLRQNRDHPVHMVGHRMAFFHLAFPLLRPLPEHLSPRRRRSLDKTFRRHFAVNTTGYLHFAWFRLLRSSIAVLLSVALAAHGVEFPRWTPGSVKLLLPSGKVGTPLVARNRALMWRANNRTGSIAPPCRPPRARLAASSLLGSGRLLPSPCRRPLRCSRLR